MLRETINDLPAITAVAEERSFTKAAAKSGVLQSALSRKLRGLGLLVEACAIAALESTDRIGAHGRSPIPRTY